MTRILVMFGLIAGLVMTGCSGTEAPESASQPAEPAAPAAASEPQEIAAADLKQRLDAGEQIFLLDVRTPEELAEHGMIAGSVNIPIDDLAARLAEIPKDQPVVTYCMRGGRAGRAVDLLRENGYTDVASGGGITAWKESGYPVVQPQ